MIWDQIQVSWKQLKEKFVLQWFRVTDDNGKSLELIGAEISWDDRSDAQPAAFTPTTAESEASFRCTLAAKLPRSSTLLVDVATRPGSTERSDLSRGICPVGFVLNGRLNRRLGPRQGRKLLRRRPAQIDGRAFVTATELA